jgi:hypothetical protein
MRWAALKLGVGRGILMSGSMSFTAVLAPHSHPFCCLPVALPALPPPACAPPCLPSPPPAPLRPPSLERMMEDKSGFAALIISRRQDEFEALKKAR